MEQTTENKGNVNITLAKLLKEWRPIIFEDTVEDGVISVGELSLSQLQDAIDLCWFCQGAVFDEGAYQELPEDLLLQESSCVVRNGFAEGMLLLRKNAEGAIVPVFLFAYGKDERETVHALTKYTLQLTAFSEDLRTPVVFPEIDERLRETLRILYGRTEFEKLQKVFE